MSAERARAPVRSAAAEKLLPRFLAHRAADLATLRNALSAGEFEVVARLGHNMHGNGRSYGFPEIEALGARLEEAAHMRDTETIERRLDELEAWLAGGAGGTGSGGQGARED
jgi:HPt (histidine-containing phosphotransfer) domain-containing protein